MRDEKQTLRARVKLRRESLSSAELYAWSSLIQEKAVAFPLYRGARNVALYSSIGNEVLTAAIAEDAFTTGKRLFYPRLIREGWVELIRVKSKDELQPGSHGILEPCPGPATDMEDLKEALVFIPGIAFDLGGGRLGRGQGAYDRLLNRLGTSAWFVALAYEFQIVHEVPTDERDQKVHYIITERRILDCLDADSASFN